MRLLPQYHGVNCAAKLYIPSIIYKHSSDRFVRTLLQFCNFECSILLLSGFFSCFHCRLDCTKKLIITDLLTLGMLGCHGTPMFIVLADHLTLSQPEKGRLCPLITSQACTKVGGRGGRCPPRFWQIRRRITTGPPGFSTLGAYLVFCQVFQSH